MKKILGIVVLSLFAISASAADLMASSAAPTVTQNIVVEGAACPGVGATGFSSTGLLLSCQSGSWARQQTFLYMGTSVANVNNACVINGDPNPPNYDDISYRITCGTRFCKHALSYEFGLVTEIAGGAYNTTKPFSSSPSTYLGVACSR